MATVLVCDYCRQQIEANYTRMAINTVSSDGSTMQAEGDSFEFHPNCYNTLQGLIVQIREGHGAQPIDPTYSAPKEQPGNPNDPTPPPPSATTPEPVVDPTVVPTEPDRETPVEDPSVSTDIPETPETSPSQ